MADRGRLVQSLKLSLKRPARAARRSRASQGSASDSRPLRFAQRWFGILIDLNVPRGAGASAAAMLLLASTVYGVVKGGHVPDIIENVQNICDDAANRAGFRISEVALTGNSEVSREDILSLAGVTGRSSLLFLDAARTRVRLLTNPWIAEAAVLKLYPGRLRMEIKERQAFALWQKAGRLSLIAADGTVLETFVPPRFSALPLVVGAGAERNARDFLELIKRYPAIAKMVDASVFVAERRWNLRLKSGIDVLLPEREPAQALATLIDLNRDKNLLARDIAAIDLRLSNRVTVRQSDTAAAARDAALKAAADKEKKAKRKDTET
jgi:cell division protein FtsQ